MRAERLAIDEAHDVVCIGDEVYVGGDGALLLATETEVQTIHEGDGVLHHLTASADGSALYFADGSKLIRFDLRRRQITDAWKVGGEGPCAILVTADDEHVYVATAGSNCALKKYAPGKARAIKSFYLGRECELVWLDSRRILVVGRFTWIVDSASMKGQELDWLTDSPNAVVRLGERVLLGGRHGVEEFLLDEPAKPRPWWRAAEVLAMVRRDEHLLVGTKNAGLVLLDREGKAERLAEPGRTSEISAVSCSDRRLAWIELTQTDAERTEWDSDVYTREW